MATMATMAMENQSKQALPMNKAIYGKKHIKRGVDITIGFFVLVFVFVLTTTTTHSVAACSGVARIRTRLAQKWIPWTHQTLSPSLVYEKGIYILGQEKCIKNLCASFENEAAFVPFPRIRQYSMDGLQKQNRSKNIEFYVDMGQRNVLSCMCTWMRVYVSTIPDGTLSGLIPTAQNG